MLCYEGKSGWARCIFQNALRAEGVRYALRAERLAYYCYFSYFWYLTEFIDCFMQMGETAEQIDEIERYLCGWIENRAAYADMCF
jgi:hypothetical protein